MTAQRPELQPAELRRITKRKQHAAQARVLDALGIPYKRHPVDGSVLVARDAVRNVLLAGVADPDPQAGAGRAEAANGIEWQTKASA